MTPAGLGALSNTVRFIYKFILLQVSTAAGYSPSQHSLRHGQRKDVAMAARQATAKTRGAKLRRRQLRESRGKSLATSELREGLTYSSSCLLTSNATSDLDTEEIPAPLFPPTLQPVDPHPERAIVFFDLETTGFSRTCDITQIAAQSSEGATFSTYMLPAEAISAGATEATGLAVEVRNASRVLTLHGKPVASVSQEEGMTLFIQWLESLGRSTLLVAHNCMTFDRKVLLNSALETGKIADLQEWVDGFADTLPALRAAVPGHTSYTLSSLYSHVIGRAFPAHNAIADVAALAELMSTVAVNLHAYSVSTPSSLDGLKFDAGKRERAVTFLPAVNAKCLTSAMATKAAESGLTLGHFRLAYRRSQAMGVEQLMKEDARGKRRVTANKRIISAITEYIASSE